MVQNLASNLIKRFALATTVAMLLVPAIASPAAANFNQLTLVASSQSPNPVARGNTASFYFTVRRTSGTGTLYYQAYSVTSTVAGIGLATDPAPACVPVWTNNSNSAYASFSVETSGLTTIGTDGFTLYVREYSDAACATYTNQTANVAGTIVVTNIALASGANPSIVGSPVTFTATVYPSSSTGTVTFTDTTAGTTTTGTIVGGVATGSFTFSSTGNHTITASYGGGTATLTQSVGQINLASGSNPSYLGRSVTFTATVSPSASGTVTFRDTTTGATTTGTLVGGVATGSFTFTSAGNHTITASYGGGTSAALTQFVTTVRLIVYSEVCSSYGIVPANTSYNATPNPPGEATGGHTGDLGPVISTTVDDGAALRPAGCVASAGWTWQMRTNVDYTNPAAGDLIGTHVSAAGPTEILLNEQELAAALQPTSTYSQPADLWVTEVGNPTSAGFAGIRCYDDHLYSDRYETVRGVTAGQTVYCIAYQVAALTLTKSSPTVNYDSTTDTISYTYAVTATGIARTGTNTTLYGVSVTDDKITSPNTVTCTPTTLTYGQAANCTATYQVTQADLDAGSVTNTATALGHFNNASGPVVNSKPASVKVPAVQTPGVTLTKTPAPDTFTAANDLITYTLTLTNTGNVTLTSPTITDPGTGVTGLTCDPAPTPFAPGASLTCHASHLITAADVTAGSFANTAHGSALFGAVPYSDDDTATVRLRQVTLAKTAAPSTYSSVNDLITYSYTITNTGNVSLPATQYSVTDDHIASPFDCGASVALAPGGTVTCSASYTITQADIDNGSVTNHATASGGGLTSNEATATVTGPEPAPAISLAKTAAPSTYSSVNDLITYSYTITNTGNVSLPATQYSVTDDHIASPFDCGASVALAPGGTVTCSASYTITQADIDNGSVTNHATASGGGLTSNEATATVTGPEPAPAISLAKTAAPSTYSSVNDLITYSYTITNTGNVSLPATQYSVTDDHIASPFDCGASVALAPGGTVTCSASYTITQADIDNGSVTNHATASGGGLTSNEATATVTGPEPAPAISLAKTAAPSTYSSVNDLITYSYTITNTGNVSLPATQYSVTDDHIASPFDCGASVALAPGGTVTCSASYTITQADIDNGSVTNHATASGGGLTSNEATATVTGPEPAPAISLAKTAAPSTYSSVNDLITYSYTITNTGNVSLPATQYSVTDDHIASPFDCGASVALAPGGTVTCSASYTITQADIDNGSVTNHATASGGGLTSNEATATVTGPEPAPAISLAKTAAPSTYSSVNDLITYSYTITNTGNVSLPATQYSVTDDHIASPFDCGASVALAPGGTVTCSASYTITQADIDNGSVTNHATASGGGLTSNEATATVTGPEPAPAISLAKTAAPSTYSSVNDLITYSYTITNTGNVSLPATQYSVTDDHIASPFDCGASVALAPGGTVTCSASYTITQADIDNGSVTNHATASGGGLTSNEATATVTGPEPAPAISLAKTAAPSTYSSVNDLITYSYTITNTGNVSLPATQYSVTDDHIASPFDCGASVALAPGGTVTCSASYTITQADIDNGSVTNHATASGGGLTSNEATATVTGPEPAPAISLAKTAAPSTYSSVNDLITYSYTITNTGNVSLPATQYSVTDDHIASPFDCGASVALAPGGTVTCSASYTITQADIDNGSVTNHATASGGGLTSNEATATVTGPEPAPAISLAKTAAPSTYSSVNDLITYSYTITNTGNVSLPATQYSVTDDHIASPFDCGASVALAPGGTVTCSASYTITQADIDNGSVTNHATASGGGLTSNEATATVTGPEPAPAISLAKTAAPSTYSSVNDLITYSYTITNTGNVSLPATQYSVTDDHIASPFDCGASVALAPGGTVTCSASYTITQADIDNGSVTNHATASGGGLTSNEATATVTGPEPAPAISLAKTAAPSTYSSVNDLITYSYTITNTGNVSLPATQYSVTDDHIASPFDCGASVALAPGGTVTCSASYTITQADIDNGSVTNHATASGGGLTSNEATATVTGPEPAPAISLAKTAAPSTYSSVNDLITYSYTITNTGNVSLPATQYSVTDDHIASPFDCGASVALAPGGTVTCSASYTITQADIDNGSVTNHATASGGGLTSNEATATVTGPEPAPAISLAKTAAPSTYSSVNDLITYSYTITNTGNVSLPATQYSVTDDHIASPFDCGASVALAPGGTVTCSASYTITRPTSTTAR